jgi:hypothetical protein
LLARTELSAGREIPGDAGIKTIPYSYALVVAAVFHQGIFRMENPMRGDARTMTVLLRHVWLAYFLATGCVMNAGAADTASADQSTEYSYAGIADIQGIRLGMSATEARGAIRAHRMANYDEQSLTLSFSVKKTHVGLGDSPVDVIEIPNTKFLNSISTDNRPALRTHGGFINYYDLVGGRVEYIGVFFTPTPSEERVVAITHEVHYDWDKSHKGILLVDLLKGFAEKYGVNVPPEALDLRTIQAGKADWGVSSSGKELLPYQCHAVHISDKIGSPAYQKPAKPGGATTGNYALGSVIAGRGLVGEIEKHCGPEILSITFEIANPREPLERQIVAEYNVQLVSPFLELVGTNKAFAIMQAADQAHRERDTARARDEGKANKPSF